MIMVITVLLSLIAMAVVLICGPVDRSRRGRVVLTP